jgi:hypothetical protein
MDDRPYKGMNGFVVLPPGTSLDAVDLARVEGLAGQFARYVSDPKVGDVIAIRNETFFYKAIAVAEVTSIKGGVQARVRTLYRGHAPYAHPELGR